MTRTESREYALKMIFAYQANREVEPEKLWEEAAETLEDTPSAFASELYFGVVSHLDELDAKISEASVGWRTERMGRVSLAVLRLAVFEITHMPDIGMKISVNEALELVRKYETEKSVSFVNGVLAKIINK